MKTLNYSSKYDLIKYYPLSGLKTYTTQLAERINQKYLNIQENLKNALKWLHSCNEELTVYGLKKVIN